MEWKLIDKEHLPIGEVLAGNFEPYTHGYKEKLIGGLYINGAGNVTCDAVDTLLYNCTHYIDINKWDPEIW